MGTFAYRLRAGAVSCCVLHFKMTGHAIDSHYRLLARVLSPSRLEKLLAQPSSLGGGDHFIFRGVLSSVECFGRESDQWLYDVVIESPLYFLIKSQGSRVFAGKTQQEIIRSMLLPRGFLEHQIVFMMAEEKVSKRCLQYEENSWNAFKRLLNKFSWHFFWVHGKSCVKICFFQTTSQLSSLVKKFDYYEQKGMVSFKHFVSRFKEEKNRIESSFRIHTNVPTIELGQKLKLSKHPVDHLNKVYRVLGFNPCGQSESVDKNLTENYQAQLELIDVSSKLRPLTCHPTPMPLFVHARIVGSGQSPYLDAQGLYTIYFIFDRERVCVSAVPFIRPYAGVSSKKAYGIHHPLLPETNVLAGFLNDDIDCPVILGALSHVEHLDVLRHDNQAEYRLATYAKHALSMNDSCDHQSIQISANDVRQSLQLYQSTTGEFVKLHNASGSLVFQSATQVKQKSGDDFLLNSSGDMASTIGKSQWLSSQSGGFFLSAKQWVDLHADGKFELISDKSDIQYDAPYLSLSIDKSMCIASRLNDLDLSGNGEFHMNALGAELTSPNIYLSSGIKLQGSMADLSALAVLAPKIDCYPAMPKVAEKEKNSKHAMSIFSKKHQTKFDKIAPLMALNFRVDDRARDLKQYSLKEHIQWFFKQERQASESRFVQRHVTEKQIQYFKRHGNNVTLFIHGYNVPYGNFGGAVEVRDEQALKGSVFSRNDIYRDPDILFSKFPDVRLVGSVPDNLTNNQLLYMKNHLSEEAVAYFNRERKINGSGAHHWWLHMEWNLNKAAKDFGGDFSKYTRMLHVAWEGDPRSAMDYMADIPTASYAASQLTTALKTLHQSGLKINVIAHSLGNYVLIKAMDLLGEEYPGIINHAFMWQAAIPNHALSQNPVGSPDYYRFPQASKAAKKITALYSRNDNILGPCMAHGLQLRKQFDESEWLSAATIAIFDVIDQHVKPHRALKSVYNMANVLGVPFSGLYHRSEARVHYYRQWRSRYKTYLGGRPLESTLPDQVLFIRHRYPNSFNWLSAIFAAHFQGQYLQLLDALMADFERGSIIELENLYHFFRRILRLRKPVKSCPYWYYIKDPAANELASIFITAFITDRSDPPDAMGYSGPDLNDASIRHLVKSGKLLLVDQTDYLHSHSGMLMPSAVVMKQVYRKHIFLSPGFSFGQHKRR